MKANQQDIQTLINVLASEAELFTSFVDLLDQQRDAIVANDMDKLNEITEQQRERLTESRILDSRRRKLVEALKADVEITGDLTVSALLDMVSEEDGLRLSQLRETILTLNDVIEDGRSRNMYLIDKSRSLIAETLKLFNRMGSKKTQGAGYTSAANGNTIHPDARMSLALDKRA